MSFLSFRLIFHWTMILGERVPNWWFETCFFFNPYVVRWSNLSIGLKPPISYHFQVSVEITGEVEEWRLMIQCLKLKLFQYSNIRQLMARELWYIQLVAREVSKDEHGWALDREKHGIQILVAGPKKRQKIAACRSGLSASDTGKDWTRHKNRTIWFTAMWKLYIEVVVTLGFHLLLLIWV